MRFNGIAPTKKAIVNCSNIRASFHPNNKKSVNLFLSGNTYGPQSSG